MSSRRKASSFGSIVTTETIPEISQAPRFQNRGALSRAPTELQGTSAPRKALGRTGKGAYRVRNSREVGCVKEVSELQPPSAAEPLPQPQPPPTDRLHLPTRPKAGDTSLPPMDPPLPPPTSRGVDRA